MCFFFGIGLQSDTTWKYTYKYIRNLLRMARDLIHQATSSDGWGCIEMTMNTSVNVSVSPIRIQQKSNSAVKLLAPRLWKAGRSPHNSTNSWEICLLNTLRCKHYEWKMAMQLLAIVVLKGTYMRRGVDGVAGCRQQSDLNVDTGDAC